MTIPHSTTQPTQNNLCEINTAKPAHTSTDLLTDLSSDSTEKESEDWRTMKDVESIDTATVNSVISNFSPARKWFILFIVAMQGFLGPLSSSIYVPSIHQVQKSLQTTSTIINATISLYIFTLGIAPMMWAAFSERYGRRFVYISATIIYVGSTTGCALSTNIAIFVAMRALQAVGASAAQAVGAGTISDLFHVQNRGTAMGLFFLGPLVGPVVGPIAGGYISEYMGWTYIFWVLTAMGGLVLIFLIFFLPETSPLIIQKKAQKKASLDTSAPEKISEKMPREQLLTTFKRPILFLFKPVVLLISLPYALAYGFMYFMISSLPHQLVIIYHFSSSQIGLVYLANGLGNVVGALCSGKYADWLLKRLSSKNQPKTPEARISPMWLGIILLFIGELVYGWCMSFALHISFTLLGLFIFGLGVGILQTPSNLYLVDAYPEYSASVISASNLLRCTMAGYTPLFAPIMLHTMGNGWSMTTLGSASIVSGVCIYAVKRWGEQMRSKDGRDFS
ncbi:major facilitator superfamily domain-containing protein [Spinellus fusiger]|nr:major facilitator superfamily domain-containing protein [Spinellus fusiger]